MTQSNMIDATIYTTLTIRGLVTDVNNLQIDVLHKQQKGLPLEQ
jgi:hypothetical protein